MFVRGSFDSLRLIVSMLLSVFFRAAQVSIYNLAIDVANVA